MKELHEPQVSSLDFSISSPRVCSENISIKKVSISYVLELSGCESIILTCTKFTEPVYFAALQYIDQIMKNITCQEDNIMSMSKERERQVELMREHQMWQRKIEYLRYGDLTLYFCFSFWDLGLVLITN